MRILRNIKHLSLEELKEYQGACFNKDPEKYNDLDLQIAWELFDRLSIGTLKEK